MALVRQLKMPRRLVDQPLTPESVSSLAEKNLEELMEFIQTLELRLDNLAIASSNLSNQINQPTEDAPAIVVNSGANSEVQILSTATSYYEVSEGYRIRFELQKQRFVSVSWTGYLYTSGATTDAGAILSIASRTLPAIAWKDKLPSGNVRVSNTILTQNGRDAVHITYAGFSGPGIEEFTLWGRSWRTDNCILGGVTQGFAI